MTECVGDMRGDEEGEGIAFFAFIWRSSFGVFYFLLWF
jgi:hypothetical protein